MSGAGALPEPPAEVEAAMRTWAHQSNIFHPDDWRAWSSLLTTVTTLVAEAIGQERERCAQIAADHDHDGYDIAARIRQAPRP